MSPLAIVGACVVREVVTNVAALYDRLGDVRHDRGRVAAGASCAMGIAGGNGVASVEVCRDPPLGHRSAAVPRVAGFLTIDVSHPPGGGASVVSAVETRPGDTKQAIDRVAAGVPPAPRRDDGRDPDRTGVPVRGPTDLSAPRAAPDRPGSGDLVERPRVGRRNGAG